MPKQPTSSITNEIPKSWPMEARRLYKPLRPLGKGGFGAVWLAESISTTSPSVTTSTTTTAGSQMDTPSSSLVLPSESPPQSHDQQQVVAIKLVGHPSSYPMDAFTKMSESGYFRRECEVLQEISHPRIVKLLHKIEQKPPPPPSSQGSSDLFSDEQEASPYCMVLEYCRGPTLEQMLKHGGALGIYMAREVAAQLVDAVSFLHGRGVIHRDIKPDNIVIAGARLLEGSSSDACWSDDVEGEEAAKKHMWNIKLIDFGFARPLHPDDIEEDKLKNNNENTPEPKDEFFGRSDIDGALQNNRHVVPKKQDSLSLSNSISHKKIRGLSAVGNRNYAAPEMLKGMRTFPKKFWTGLSSSSTRGGGGVDKELMKKRMHEQSLADAISDYGMTADAYSVGTTLRYMLTGVPPDVSINDFMASKNSVLSKVGRSLKSLTNKNKDGPKNKMKKRYKYTRELPSEAAKVVLGLTHWNERIRTTVRSARNYEWIRSSYCMKDEKEPMSSNEHHGEINFLKCALER
eukprot:CAMPEP_0176497746 /NCGR_PEP_ID=MMETSP0200_2-20121128/11901_1 /TAXON_ID=947934 /ORGANISM="Chaetoceros sp., Strain GSL56" /LENGTH=515 /DNA_ID=CAMNT_0017895805 /DNA_START=75 /DNA_END=1619 /DNA_ORIENTATION=+